MAVIQLVVLAERWLDQVILYGTTADGVGADFSDTLVMPAGLGDVALMEMQVLIGGITTAIDPANKGMRADVNTVASLVDIIGMAQIYSTGATRMGAYFSPDPLVLVRQEERIGVTGPDLETTATGDAHYYVKCVRVRPKEEPAAGPVRLVR